MSAKDNADSIDISVVPPVGREPERHPEAAGAREIAKKAMNGGNGQRGRDEEAAPNNGQSRNELPGSRSRFSFEEE